MISIKEANDKFREKSYSEALRLYEKIGAQSPDMKNLVHANIELSKIRLNSKAKPVTAAQYQPEKLIATDATPRIVQGNSKDYEGKLEKVGDGSFKGWVVSKKRPGATVEIDVLLDGTLFKREKNTGSRQDLARHGKSKGLGGFSFSIPGVLLDRSTHKVELRFPDGVVFAQAEIDGQKEAVKPIPTWVPVNEPVSVIVPIYNALDDVKVCIERLIQYTGKDTDIILINDASPDPEIAKYLESIEVPENFRIFHNEQNLGFTKTVNKGIKLAGNNDVVLLNSDARVTPRWLVGMKRALARDARIATVTPMSDRAGAFSAPNIGNENELPAGVTEESYALAFRRRSVGYYPTVPTGNGFCMYIRRAAINEVGLLDEEAFPRGYGEENDFCMRARAKGWRSVVDDRTYVFHDRNKSFGGQKTDLIAKGRAIVDQRYPDYKKAIRVFSDSSTIAGARFRAKQAVEDLVASGGSVKPRVLYVVSTLTGGTPQTNRDLMLALSDRVEPWLLHCDSQVISLYRVFKDNPDELVVRVRLTEEVEPLTHSSPEYDRVLTGLLSEYDFSLVHIRHLGWHSLSLPRLAKEAGAKVVKSFHDFYAICPTVKLLDENNIFCEGQCTKTSGECTIDLWKNKDALPNLKNGWVHEWRKNFKEKVIDYSDAFVTTHESVKHTYIKIFGNIGNFYVIPHGRDFEKFENFSEPYLGDGKLKILVPGNVSAAKGGDVIREVAALFENLEFHILGKSSLPGVNNIFVHGEYQRDDFSNKVKDIKPHLGMVMSIWNETWCHTLTEMWSVGLPVIVSNFQTLASRVESFGGGWITDPSAKGVSSLLSRIAGDSKEIAQKVDCVTMWQEWASVHQNVREMGCSYFSVYMEEGRV